jgi:zinc transport system substrate-binding protein
MRKNAQRSTLNAQRSSWEPSRLHGFFCSVLLCCFALASQAGEKPVVFVSIPPQAWLVKRLAGDAVEVQTLLTSGANPHTFEPTARQVKKLSSASLYFTLGMPFEVSLAKRAAGLNAALRVTGMDAGIAKIAEPEHAHHHEPGHVCGAGGDPHIWLSPRLMCAMASNTVSALGLALPERRASFEGRLQAALGELAAADAALREKLGALRVKTWVVYHPSWAYFARDYGLALLVIEQDGKAPSARHLAEVIAQARAAGVKAVCAEPQYDQRPAQLLAQQLGARLVTVNTLQEDWPALMRDAAEKLAGGDVR